MTCGLVMKSRPSKREGSNLQGALEETLGPGVMID